MEDNIVDELNTEKKTPSEIYRDPSTNRFKKGNPGGGRPKETPEKKASKKAIKELVAKYKETLIGALPKIAPILIERAISGDIKAIRELNDRAMGKPPQDLNLGNQEDLPFTINIVRDDGKSSDKNS